MNARMNVYASGPHRLFLIGRRETPGGNIDRAPISFRDRAAHSVIDEVDGCLDGIPVFLTWNIIPEAEQPRIGDTQLFSFLAGRLVLHEADEVREVVILLVRLVQAHADLARARPTAQTFQKRSYVI